jgi:hypothetical protein
MRNPNLRKYPSRQMVRHTQRVAAAVGPQEMARRAATVLTTGPDTTDPLKAFNQVADTLLRLAPRYADAYVDRANALLLFSESGHEND